MSRTKEALRMAGLAVDAIGMIQGYTKLGGDKAAAALKAIGAIVSAVQGGLDGKAAPDEVARDLQALYSGLEDNDAAADSALDRKFRGDPDDEPTGPV
jgi:hypothetical protein